MKELIKEIILLCIITFLGYYAFHIPAIVMFLIIIISTALLMSKFHKIEELKLKMENEELMEKITINSSDVKVKRRQLMSMISCLSSPLVLLDEKGEMAIYNEAFNELKKDVELENKIKKIFVEAFISERKSMKTTQLGDKEYNVEISPIKLDNRYQGSVLIFQDLTKIKEKEKYQKEFIANASHELKTPITAIKGMVEILNREDFNDDKTRDEFLKQIEFETSRLESLTDSLMDLSAYDQDAVVLNRHNIDFTDIANISYNSFLNKANKLGIKINRNYQTTAKVFVDSERMLTVVNNLVNNAIKYSESNIINLNYYEENHYVIFEVQDFGKGISEEDKKHIFDRFYRVDKARSRKQGGSGLGLSIVKEICDKQNIEIQVLSEVDKGTTFKLIFKC